MAALGRKSALNCLGIEEGTLTTWIAHVGSTRMETALGSDVLLMVCSTDGVKERCHVMNIQFKATNSLNGKKLNVERSGWRQFKRLVSAQTSSKGKIRSWYGLLRNRWEGMDSVIP